MTQIRHIVFDIGMVVLHWDRDLLYRDLIPDPEARRRFLAEICTMEWNRSLDAGLAIDEAIRDLSHRHPAEAERVAAYKTNWLNSLRAIDGAVDILEKLLDLGFDVTALSNFNQDLFALTRRAYPFLDRFRGITVSGEVRMAKPDAAIYAHHAEPLRPQPGRHAIL